MSWKVVGGLAQRAQSSIVVVVAKVCLQGESSETEQRSVDIAGLQGMLELVAVPVFLDATSMTDDIVAQLQVVVVSCSVIAQ